MKNRDYNTAFFLYDESKKKVENTFDNVGRMHTLKKDSDEREVTSFYKDGLTIKARFIKNLGKNGETSLRKIGYNKKGVKRYETDFDNGSPVLIRMYNKGGEPVKVIEYENGKVSFIAMRDKDDKGIWYKDFLSGKYVELQELINKESKES